MLIKGTLDDYSIVAFFNGNVATACQVGDYVIGGSYLTTTEQYVVTGGALLQTYPSQPTSSSQYHFFMAKCTSTSIKVVGNAGDTPSCCILRKS